MARFLLGMYESRHGAPLTHDHRREFASEPTRSDGQFRALMPPSR